ncbi:MAG TPA: DUF1552 domain-containing protein [Polyangiaceae bacterium]|nr:DUF1552 domain-containing protein [Polyangiaceae bacterium]
MKIQRRTLLRGLGGLAFGLPWLESLNSTAHAQAAGGPKRFIVFFEHGGTISANDKDGDKYDGNGANNGVDGWAPIGGEKLELGAIHQPLQAHLDSLLVLRGINNRACQRQSPYNGDHGWANVTALTSANATQLGDKDEDIVSEGPSIDAVLAERLAERNPVAFPSVNLTVPAHNYGTPFFRAARQPVEGEYNPMRAFDKLFAGVTEGAQPDRAALRARALKASVLDGVGEGLSLFRGRLSAADRIAVDAHLEHIRGLERQLESIAPAVGCQKPTLSGLDKNWDYYSVDIQRSGPAQIDIMLAAMRCGLTNVATLNIGDFYAKFLNPTFPAAYDIGHSLHHSARDVGKAGPDGAKFQAWYDTMLANRRWRMGLLARLLDGLANTREGDGTMLDNTLILCASEFSCGADHSVADLPILLAGKAGGRLRTGRHVNFNSKASADPQTRSYETRASLHNLFTSVLQLFDFPDAHFGSDHAWERGPLAGLS